MTFPSTVMVGNKDKISHQVIPNGGWKYQQGSLVIRGFDWIELVKNVREHRKANKIPDWNCEAEIENQILILQPNLRIK